MFKLEYNYNTMEWEIWLDLRDRGKWKKASVSGSKALAEKVMEVVESAFWDSVLNM